MKFIYHAKRGPDDHVDGEVDAPNERLAIGKILQMGLTPIQVKAFERGVTVKPSQKAARFFNIGSHVRFNFTQSDVVLFFRYLADFLNADIPVMQSVRLTRKRFAPGRMFESLVLIEQALQDGSSLSESLRRSPEIFSDLHVNMLLAGEVSGMLKETTDRLATFLEQDHENRMKVLSSLIYPGIIVSVGMVTIFVLLTWVIPKVMVIFNDMDQQLPLITQALMLVSTFFAYFWWLVLVVMGISVMLFIRWYGTQTGREKWDRIIFSIPGMGRFLRETSMARFSRTLGALIQGGVDLVPALNYAAGVIQNVYVRKQITQCAQGVAEGMSVSQAFKDTDFFLESDISMISVGEETGGLSASLIKLASFYEKNNDRMIKMITTMIEPALILGLGLVIGFVVLAMLMPIFQMNLGIS